MFSVVCDGHKCMSKSFLVCNLYFIQVKKHSEPYVDVQIIKQANRVEFCSKMLL
jgi:hypothetical protein